MTSHLCFYGSQVVFAPNFVLSLQRLTGKTPDNLEELREMALDVEEEDEEEEDTQDEDEVHTHSDSEEEASDQEEAADDWHRLPLDYFFLMFIFQMWILISCKICLKGAPEVFLP